MHTLNDISCMKTNLVESLEYEMRCCGTDNMDICKTGQIVDMIKDLAEAEKDTMKACYYGTVVDAMHEEHPQNERMGYDHWRYSSGRYAPTGKGHYSAGYTPMHDGRMPVYMNEHENRMGYDNPSGSSRDGRSSSSNDRMGYPGEAQMRHAFDDYRTSKRFYTETKDASEKEKMHHYAEKHLDETTMTLQEIWNDADPELKKKMKGEMSKLLATMQV